MKKLAIFTAFTALIGFGIASVNGREVVKNTRDARRCLYITVGAGDGVCPYLSGAQQEGKCPYLSDIPKDTKCPYLKALKEGKNTGRLTSTIDEKKPSPAELKPWLFVKAKTAEDSEQDSV